MRLRFARQIEIIFVEIVYIEWRPLFLSGNYCFLCFIQFQSRNCNSLWTVQFLFENCGSRTVMQFPFGNCIAFLFLQKKSELLLTCSKNSVLWNFPIVFYSQNYFSNKYEHIMQLSCMRITLDVRKTFLFGLCSSPPQF